MTTLAYARHWCCELCDFSVLGSEEESMQQHSLEAHGIDFSSPYANAGMRGDIMVISDMAVNKPTDPLVERSARYLYEEFATFAYDVHIPTWDEVKCDADLWEHWTKQAQCHLKALSEPLSDGSRIVRTDPDQTLPSALKYCHDAVEYGQDMIAAGWVKVLPLLSEVHPK